MFRLVLVFSLILGLASTASPSVANAQPTGCGPGQTPHYVFGFADLKAMLGDAMGDPVTCEYPDPNGTGDVHQETSKGLAFWRKSTNTPTFTNGDQHWAHTTSGWVTWFGTSIDPTADAQAWPPAPAAPAAPSPVPAAAPPSTPAPAASSSCGAPANPWGYNYCGGNRIYSPPSNLCSYFSCIPSFWNQTNGYVVQCRDGLLSHSGGVRGSCSSHQGESRPLYGP